MSPQRERVTSGRLSDPPVLFDANWKPVGPSRVLPGRSEMNLAASRTVKLLPAHPIWLFRKFCIIRISGRLVSACQRTDAERHPSASATRGLASHTEFPMNSRALSCNFVHFHPPPPVHGASGSRALAEVVKDPPQCPNILSLRQECPSLASVSGKWSLLDGMSAIATGSFCRNQSHQ